MSILSDISRIFNSVTNATVIGVHAVENLAKAADESTGILADYGMYHRAMAAEKHQIRMGNIKAKAEKFAAEEQQLL